MCTVLISKQTAVISLHSFNWVVFITKTVCVYCVVRTESLNETHNSFRLIQVFSHRPFTMEAWVRSQASPCKICGKQNGIETYASLSISVFRWRHHPSNVPHSSSSLLPQGQRGEDWKPSKTQRSFIIRGSMDIKVLSLFLFCFRGLIKSLDG
jgi:hypothetical protein